MEVLVFQPIPPASNMGDKGGMVLAGSVPGRSNHPLENAHRQTIVVLAGALVMLLFLAWSVLSFINPVASYFTILPSAIAAFLWGSFRRKRPFALPFVIATFTISSLLFLLFSVLTITSGGTGLILGVLMLFMAWSSFKRLLLLKHPLFRAWYSGQGMNLPNQSQLKEGEMIASCPHCESTLAIIPMLLTPEDNCPHCMRPLVLSETAERIAGLNSDLTTTLASEISEEE